MNSSKKTVLPSI